MKKILFIASKEEAYYYKPFIEECEKKNLDIHIFDPNALSQNMQINFFFDSNKDRIDGFIDTLKTKKNSFVKSKTKISEIEVAWYIRVRSIKKSSREDSIEKRFSENEFKASTKGLLSTLECHWINKKESIDFLSSNKMYQQIVAERCGLSVPRTIISNSFENILSFSKTNKKLLLKPMGYIRFDKEGEYFLYSQLFSRKEIESSKKSIETCPIFVQEYIPKKYEHRVMAIGNEVLSCLIDSQASKKTEIDWRHYDFENVRHARVELPSKIKQRILSFMEEVGLKYGAIDMIQTPDDDYVFLEINPSGQWEWIQELGKLPITKTVANMLFET